MVGDRENVADRLQVVVPDSDAVLLGSDIVADALCDVVSDFDNVNEAVLVSAPSTGLNGEKRRRRRRRVVVVVAGVPVPTSRNPGSHVVIVECGTHGASTKDSFWGRKEKWCVCVFLV